MNFIFWSNNIKLNNIDSNNTMVYTLNDYLKYKGKIKIILIENK